MEVVGGCSLLCKHCTGLGWALRFSMCRVGVDFWDAVLFFWVKLMCFHDMVVFFLIV